MKRSTDLDVCYKSEQRIRTLLRTREASEVSNIIGVSLIVFKKYLERSSLSHSKIKLDHSINRVKKLTLKNTAMQIVKKTGYSKSKVYSILRKIREQKIHENSTNNRA